LLPKGQREGPPAYFEWRWRYQHPSVLLWAVLGLLLIGPRHNRNRQAWLILALPLATIGWRQLALAFTSGDDIETVFYLAFSVSTAWACVWLLAPWLQAKSRLKRALMACAVMAVVTVVGGFSYFGFVFTGDTMGMWAFLGGMSTVILVGSMAMSARCRDRFHGIGVVFLWLMLWMPVICLVCVFCLCMVAIGIMGAWRDLPGALCASTSMVLMFSLFLYILNLPVMLLVLASRVYRERFEILFCTDEPGEPAWDAALADMASEGEERRWEDIGRGPSETEEGGL
jgi:hypothetical protein